jgi:PAS domain S-box-containing protein
MKDHKKTKAQTDRRQAEKNLIKSEECYRIAIENSNGGIALVRGDRNIYKNRKILEIFGYETPDNFIGNPLRKRTP